MLEAYREHLRYEPESGKLFWIKRSSNVTTVGDIAGALFKNGYIVVGISGKKVGAHRIAWALHYGEMPIGEIDHINGDKIDNRICNLRVVSRSQQLMNTRIRSDNTSGVKGVGFHKLRGKWFSRVKRDGKVIYKSFERFEEAVKHREYVQELMHGEYARKVA